MFKISKMLVLDPSAMRPGHDSNRLFALRSAFSYRFILILLGVVSFLPFEWEMLLNGKAEEKIFYIFLKINGF